jgi:Zn-dependent peptidase ImmA (M78 family)/transcriptional regulator with XRE-family HTH domain
MAITQQELGRRIRAAREACRMTQEEAAEHLGLSRSPYVQIENGNRSVSSLELDRLAYLFGRDIRAFMGESFEEEDTLAALFRAQPDVARQAEVTEKLRECLALGHELARLERFVGLDRDLVPLPSYAFPPPGARWEAVEQGQRLAEEERRRLGLGPGAVSDLGELLESQGVHTGMVELPEDVSGLTLSDRNLGFFVVVNQGHAYLRRRFSMAHEYAHVLADRDRFGLVSKSSERSNLIEVRANTFAACFLMPAEGVRQFVSGLGKGSPSRPGAEVYDGAGTLSAQGRTEPGTQRIQVYDVVQLAHAFGVSVSAMLYRLKNLRILTDPEFERLAALDRDGKTRQVAVFLGIPEPDHSGMRSAFRLRFLGLALEAYRREEISRGKLAELATMMGCPDEDLDALMEEAEQAPQPDDGQEEDLQV